MNDPLISLVKIAGFTLLVTILWALSLGIAYWDIQRRKQAGQQVNTLLWMVVVALLPFIGLVGYFIARLLSRVPTTVGQGTAQPGGRRETKLKKPPEERKTPAVVQEAPPAARQQFPTILGADFAKDTVLGQPNSAAPAVALPIRIQHIFSVTRGPEQGKTFLVDRFPSQIGRDLDSLIRLDQDGGVSRKHALIEQIDGALRIRDLKSTHGTWVNGQPVGEQILQPGDHIEVGLTCLTYAKEEH